ncbi:hypothetical protein ACIRNI_12100 [Streptomyces sp. NPDC093546]|uniref:hypothetical protein n=1 Tax=Streptomyces sp. NPDC093546 TaxID=3366040 RepID=UPI003820AB9F
MTHRFALLGGDDDAKVWDELWNDLCHQGCVYDDSFAALPFLAAIATGRAPGDREQAVLMAGLIASAADEERRARYATEIAELLPVARACLAACPADDASTFVYLTQCLLAFEGEPVWSDSLEGLFTEEFEVECPDPGCGAMPFVIFGDHAEDDEAETHPADPSELTGIAQRLHRMASEAGQTGVARGVTYLFGRATCPECDTEFSVSERVAAPATGG